MKIVIFNTVSLNGGDAAILEASVELLREAFGETVEFVVYDKDGSVAGRYHPGLPFRRSLSQMLAADPLRRRLGRRIGRIVALARLWAATWSLKHGLPQVAERLLPAEQLRAVREYLGADLLVSVVGTHLVEYYDLGRGLEELRFALFCGPPLVLFPQSLGPFMTPKHQRAVRRVLERARLVLLRDERSLRHLERLPVRRCQVHVVADAAFALGLPFPGPSLPVPRGDTGLSIGISVRPWPEWIRDGPSGPTQYRAALGELVAHLVDRHGARVTFVSTCQGIPEYWADDSQLASEIADALPSRIRASVSVDRDRHTPHEFARLMAAQAFVVATRLHAAILALAVGTPVLPIAYEFKTEELFKRLGLGRWVQDIRHLDARDLSQAVDAFLAALPAIREQVRMAVAAERAQARRCVTLVRDAFEQRSHS